MKQLLAISVLVVSLGILSVSPVSAKARFGVNRLQVKTILNQTGDVTVQDNLDVLGQLSVTKNLKDASAGTAALISVGGSDTISATTDQYGLQVDNVAAVEAVDSLLVLDNSDRDSVVGAAIEVMDAGGGFEAIINNNGTLLSSAELNVLDDGITIDELINIGTLTATIARLNLHLQTFTMSTTGAAAENLTPTTSYIEVTGQDTSSDTIVLQTSSALEGDVITITNTSAFTVSIVANATTKLELGLNKALTQYDVIQLIFDGTNWLQLGAVANNS